MKDIIRSGKVEMRERVKQVYAEIKDDPHTKRPTADVKLISTREEGIYRIRLGEYRIVYAVDEVNKRIMITKIFIRGKGY